MWERVKQYMNRVRYEWELARFYVGIENLGNVFAAKRLTYIIYRGARDFPMFHLLPMSIISPSDSLIYLSRYSENIGEVAACYAKRETQKELKKIIDHGKRALELGKIVKNTKAKEIEKCIKLAKNILFRMVNEKSKDR